MGDNINIGLKNGWKGMDWIAVAQGTFGSMNEGAFLDQLRNYWLFKNDAAPYVTLRFVSVVCGYEHCNKSVHCKCKIS
jgi:hypothetical protein